MKGRLAFCPVPSVVQMFELRSSPGNMDSPIGLIATDGW
jgi:hypothetical protein